MIQNPYGYYQNVGPWGPPLEWGANARAQWMFITRPAPAPVFNSYNTFVAQPAAPQRPLLSLGNLLSIG